MINVLFSSFPAFISCTVLVGFIGFWFILGCFRLLWWLFGGVNHE